ncbi:hypothetical protein CERSUDRAFT_82780 [Gelatoporia subvermispora B]|uniref:ClpP/crotonase n=1 Tax=Ceriporiopsis subvermispora (strain B) TaxID=914234 RepID=M2RI94_CERS8|nr:hypothetical protein CERSUDRAFT_82780 [Gelatoporia subvermispora B]
MSTITVEVAQGIATITLNRPESFNALTREDYDAFAQALRDVDKRDDVLLTVWQATGKWFCSGTSVTQSTTTIKPGAGPGTRKQIFVNRVASTNTDTAQALYSHTKILVAALNGPVMGIAAAFLGHFDFIYCMPEAWLSVPFTFIGIITEGGSSATFTKRMGVAKANEVLIFGKKQTAQDLLECGFVNQIFPTQNVPDFHAAVRTHLLKELEGLDPVAVLGVKKLLKAAANEQNDFDAVNLRESYAQVGRFESGVPGKRFAELARRELRHKL